MSKRPRLTRRRLLAGGFGLAALAGAAAVLRRRLWGKLANLTQLKSFTQTPALLPHDPVKERARVYVAQGGSPADNIDAVLAKLGGIGAVVGAADVVIIKVAAQWWNQGMTNVAAVKRVIEQVLARPGFAGEVIVFENTHFRMPDGSGLSRAWVADSDRNVDVPGWRGLGDLRRHFEEGDAPVSFVGLVDAGESLLSDDGWHDPAHRYGRYGGDGRGPIAHGDARDGYRWDREDIFALKRSWFDEARTPLTWPRFSSPRSGLVVDFRDGLMKRQEGALVPAEGKLCWINMTTCNEHAATGLTAATKSTMGVVDMSAGMMGTHPLARDFRSVHYFGMGAPRAMWRMAGPLATFAARVRAPDLILTVAEWVAFTPALAPGETLDNDIRHDARAALRKRTVVAGTDPVAMDSWICRNLMHDVPSAHHRERLALDNEDAAVVKFLRYYRQVRGAGTLLPELIDVA